MSQRRRQRQLPWETRQWIEQRLLLLDRAERFEDAYAINMEMAEWLLQGPTDLPCTNLTVSQLLGEGSLQG